MHPHRLHYTKKVPPFNDCLFLKNLDSTYSFKSRSFCSKIKLYKSLLQTNIFFYLCINYKQSWKCLLTFEFVPFLMINKAAYLYNTFTSVNHYLLVAFGFIIFFVLYADFSELAFLYLLTIAPLNYEILQMAFIPTFPSMQLKWLSLFLIYGSQQIMIKWSDF